jgi:hypothetical protein
MPEGIDRLESTAERIIVYGAGHIPIGQIGIERHAVSRHWCSARRLTILNRRRHPTQRIVLLTDPTPERVLAALYPAQGVASARVYL